MRKVKGIIGIEILICRSGRPRIIKNFREKGIKPFRRVLDEESGL